jgi:hypothetical protein
LPLKSTANTSTPVLRIGALDNYAHITDFASAADHYLTLKKWQELGIPMSAEKRNVFSKRRPGTFNWHLDSTGPGARKAIDQQRWGFKSPVYDLLDARGFQRYLLRKIQPRRQEFREFVRKVLENSVERHKTNEAHGAPVPKKIDFSDASVDLKIQSLRKDTIALQRLVVEFLGLPVFEQYGSLQPYAPQKTHPSAGLSYLRTDARLANEPGRGFTSEITAIGRVLVAAKRLSGYGNTTPVIGINGFAVKTNERPRDHDQRPPEYLDIARKGGGKVLLRVDLATVDADGRVSIEVTRVDKAPLPEKMAEGLRRGTTTPRSESRAPASTRTLGSGSGAAYDSSGGYGVGSWKRFEAGNTNRPASRKPEATPHSGLVGVIGGY